MLHLQALSLDGKPDPMHYFTVAGSLVLEVYNMFLYSNDKEKDKFDTVVQTFDEHCSPKKIETLEH